MEEVPGKDIMEFLPLKLGCQMLLKGRVLDVDLHSVLINYSILESEEFQNYVQTSSILPLSFAKKFSMILLKLPSQVQLIYNIINPQLKCSLAFQLSNMRNKSRAYIELVNYLRFLNDFFICVSNTTLLERIMKAIFNQTLVKVLQPRIVEFSSNPSAARTSLQYILLFLEYINSKPLASLMSYFLFGFGKNLNYSPIKDIYTGSRIGETDDSSIDIPPESKSLCDINFGESMDKSNTSLIAFGGLLEESKESTSLLFDETLKEEGKDAIKPEELIESINLEKYEAHDSTTITSLIINSINYERGCYSIISLQLIDKLLSFSIKEIYDLLIFNGIKKPLTDYKRKTVKEIAQLFPNSKMLIDNIKSIPSDSTYRGLDILLSDYNMNKESINKEKLASYDVSHSVVISSSEAFLKPIDDVTRASNFMNKFEDKIKIESVGMNNMFIDNLLKKLNKFLYNSFDENLFLSSILTKLFAIPLNESSSALEFILLNDSENSVITILKRIVEEVRMAVQDNPKLIEMIKRTKEMYKKATITSVKGKNVMTERFIDVLYLLTIGHHYTRRIIERCI